MSNELRRSDLGELTCPECGDEIHLRFNSCPRCLIFLRSDPDYSEAVAEIDRPPSVECFAVIPKTALKYVLAEPDPGSRRLFVMSEKDVLPIRNELEDFYEVATPARRDGFVSKRNGFTVRVATRSLEDGEAQGFFRANEHLIGWKKPHPPFVLREELPIRAEPNFKSQELGRIKADVVLPVVGETYGWFMVQLPSGIRGWIPEAYGFRMLQADSLPGATAPTSGEDIVIGIAGLLGAMTLAGIGALLED